MKKQLNEWTTYTTKLHEYIKYIQNEIEALKRQQEDTNQVNKSLQEQATISWYREEEARQVKNKELQDYKISRGWTD
jgi:hypothetical protein